MRMQLTYVGVRELTNGKLGHKYIEVESGREWVFSKKLMNLTVGTIIELDRKDDETVGGNRKFIGYHEDDAQRTKWFIESRAIEGDFKDRQRAKADNPLFKRLDPIRAAYRETSAPIRRQILADVIRYITDGRP